jgi:hypothetical protein
MRYEVSWMEKCRVEVEADSHQEAIKKVADATMGYDEMGIYDSRTCGEVCSGFIAEELKDSPTS